MDIVIAIVTNLEYILIPFIILYFYLDRPFTNKDYEIYKYSIEILHIFGNSLVSIYTVLCAAVYSISLFISLCGDPLVLEIHENGYIKIVLDMLLLLVVYELSFYYFFIRKYKFNYLQVILHSKYHHYRWDMDESIKDNYSLKGLFGSLDDFLERVTSNRWTIHICGIVSIVFAICSFYLAGTYIGDHYSLIEKYYPDITISGKYTEKELVDIFNYIDSQRKKNYEREKAKKPITIEDTTDNVKILLKNIEKVVTDSKRRD